MNNPYFRLIRTIWHYGVPWRGTIIGYYIAYILARAIRNLAPYAFGKTIDILQNFKPDRLGEVIYWLIVGVGVVLVYWLLHAPTRVIERNTALKIQQAFQLNLYEKLTQLPLKWHQEHHSGNTVTRINRASNALYDFAEDQFIYIQTIVTFFTSIGFLLWISPVVGVLSLITSAFSMFTVIWFDRKLTRLYDTQNEIENKLGAVLFDYLNNMTTVLTLRLGSLTHGNLAQCMKSIWPSFKKDVVTNEVKWFTMEMLLTISQTIILIGYIIYTLHATGAIMIGVVIMIFRYQWELGSVFQELSIHYSRLVHMNTDIETIEPLLSDIKKFAHKPAGIEVARQWSTIQVRELCFQHNKVADNKPTFNDLSFTIQRGEKIALIGSSGGGKSTLLNLLSGLYTPSKVNLLIDGVSFDILEPLQSIATLIPQDPEIFENTVYFNITMGLPAEPAELQRIMQLSRFSSVLEKLSEGLETYIHEKGLNLSVGQKQRLALARGLFAARFSSLILMDEPTSSLDLQTEKEIFSDVIRNLQNSTMIISLHRLHLLPLFSRIIMLDKQGIIADGPAKELLNEPGVVRDLWKKYQAHSENEN
ncbi:MAG: ABC transporter ATP-binding protein [Candidatus Amoebophilus sp.]